MITSIILFFFSAVVVTIQSRPINYTTIDCTWLVLGADFLFGILAESLDPPEMEFLLYTRKNPIYSESLVLYNESSIRKSNFRAEICTKFLIHGYQASAEQGFYPDLKTVLLSREDCNIVIVDWKDGASKFYFPGAMINAFRVGKNTAAMITFLQRTVGIALNQVHVIGFSLGAQVAGFTGKRLNKLGRISAIDPAGVCFDSLRPEYRLNTTDASFVDLLVTTAGTIGMVNPAGHVNIYLNGGEFQPDCTREVVQNVNNNMFQGYSVIFDNCSHTRAIEFYTETALNPNCQPLAYSCSDYATFEKGGCAECGDDGTKCTLAGIDADKYVQYLDGDEKPGGVFYLDTTSSSPFCVYHYQVTINIASNENVPLYGKAVVSFSGDKIRNVTAVFQRLELFEPGHIYTYLFKNRDDIFPVTSASFFWFFYPIYGLAPESPGLYIRSIQLRPMTLVARNSIKTVYSFCGKKGYSVPPGVTTFLHPSVDC